MSSCGELSYKVDDKADQTCIIEKNVAGTEPWFAWTKLGCQGTYNRHFTQVGARWVAAINRRIVVVDFNVAVACVVGAEDTQVRWVTGAARVRIESLVAVLQTMNDE